MPFGGTSKFDPTASSVFTIVKEDGTTEVATSLVAADLRAAELITGGTAVRTILLPSGDIAESVTLTAPGVTWIPVNGPGSTSIVGAVATGTRLTFGVLAVDTRVLDVLFLLPTDALPAVKSLSSSAYLNGCFLQGAGASGIGVDSAAAGGVLDVTGLTYELGTADTIITQSEATATLNAQDVHCESGTLNSAVDLQAGTVFISVLHAAAGATEATVTDFIKLGAVTGRIARCTISSTSVTNAVRVTSDAVNFTLDSISTEPVSGSDILVDPALTGTGARLSIPSGHLSVLYKLNASSTWLSNATFISNAIDPEAGELTQRVIGAEVSIGTAWKGQELSVGGGDSHTQGMVVLSNSNLEIGTWLDITSDVNRNDGSSSDIFNALTTGACLYIGGRWQFPGFKALVSTAGDELQFFASSPNAIVEIWDGAWVEVQAMGADAVLITPHGATLSRAASNEHLRLGPLWNTTVTKTLNGNADMYWARVRLLAGITTSPAFNQFKVHTSHWESNPNGKNEYFGDARPLDANIPGWSLETMTPIVGAAPASHNIAISSNITLATTLNEFQSNKIDRIGGKFSLPDWVDTSYPLRLRMKFTQSQAGTGDVVAIVYVSIIKPGDPTDGTAIEYTIPDGYTVPGTLDETFDIDTDICLNLAGRVEPGDEVVISYERTGTDSLDTGPHIAILNTVLTATRWKP